MSVLTDVDLRAGLNRLFVIHPISESSITSLGYDLRIGFSANLSISEDKLAREGKVVIPGLSSTFVISKEHVWLSSKVVGTLHSRGSLAAKGLILNSTTIDPNWSGQLTFLIFNSSDKDVELGAESTFITLMIHMAESPTQNGPSTNPIVVANNYGDAFGVASKHRLLEFINSGENKRTEKEFMELIQKARTPSLGTLVVNGWKNLFPKGRMFFQNRFMDLFYRASLILGLIADVITFLAWGSFRAFLLDRLGLDVGPYDNKILALQVTTFYVIIGQLRSGSKKT